MEPRYSSGPDLSEYFPKRPHEQRRLPPALFSKQCDDCEKPLEEVRQTFLTYRRPYLQYYCSHCHTYLYIFEAPRTPYLLKNEKIAGILRFSEFIEDKIAEREEKHQRDLVRDRSSAR